MSDVNDFSAQNIARRIYGGFNVTAPGANTGILPAAVTFNPKASVCRMAIALTVASVVNVTAYNGTTTHKWGVNESNALQAGDLYTFAFPVLATDQSANIMYYDFEVETDGVIETLTVDEIIGAAV